MSKEENLTKEKVISPELVQDKEVKLTLGNLVLRSFLLQMKKYREDHGVVIWVVQRLPKMLEEDITLGFKGTEKEYGEFIEYLKKLDSNSKSNLDNL